MLDSAQVVIVGAGVMGASVAYHLAARGVTDVLVVERGSQPVSGSTARSAAGVRHQFSTPTNVKLSQWSIERLKHFRANIGVDSGLQQVGYLFVINHANDWHEYQRHAAMQRSLGVQVELLTPDEAARYLPGLATDDLVGATFCPDDGYCDPIAVATGYLQRAQAMGARLRCDTTVTGVQVVGDRIVGVETADGAIGAEILVNAAGPWAGRIAALAGLELPVQPVRRSLYMTMPFDAVPPRIPLTLDVASGFWMRKHADRVIMGLARRDEPSSENTNVDWEWFETVQAAGIARVPALAAAVIDRAASWAGLYEVSPDSNPILGRHPDLDNYVDISGFSGHGIMHAPAAGMLIAEEIIDNRAHTIPIDDLRIGRFADTGPGERRVF